VAAVGWKGVRRTAGDGAGEVIGRRPVARGREEDYMSKMVGANRCFGPTSEQPTILPSRRIRLNNITP